MSLKDQIREDMKAAIKQREVNERITIDDAGVVAVVDNMLKQRKDSITQFQAAGRDDLVAQEQSEVTVLVAYMLAQLSEAEVADAVQTAIVEMGAAGPQDMGKVMGMLKARLAGKAVMSALPASVKTTLSTK
ncbi:MAG: GatB/YqeY domain-containing protein [Burkholderia sp.]